MNVVHSLERLDAFVLRLRNTAPAWAQAHKKPLSAAFAGLLVLGTATAVAVSRAPDPADLPVRQVAQSVQPLDLLAQSQQLANHDFRLTRSEVSRANDSVDALLARLGVVDAQASLFLRTDTLAKSMLLGRGRLVQAEVNDAGQLLRLTQRWSADDEVHFKRLTVERKLGSLQSKVEMAPLVATQRIGSGTIKSSLFAATDEARMPDVVAVQMAEIFAGDIDFHRSLRKGDRFHVVYEALEADGELLKTGRVLAAEFVNAGKSIGAIWFQELGKKGGYYTASGESLRKAYLTSPLEFSRVTSGFKMRFHPLLNKWRAHLGVDYAAPTGTPARTVGDGTVEFAGWQNGYGNVVIVKHRSNHTTLYAHLSKVSVKKGQSVSQGQTIGNVGSTGWSTGPHLHFEFRIDGVHKDPLTIAKQSESIPLPASAMADFKRHAQAVKRDWAAAASMTVASAQ